MSPRYAYDPDEEQDEHRLDTRIVLLVDQIAKTERRIREGQARNRRRARELVEAQTQLALLQQRKGGM